MCVLCSRCTASPFGNHAMVYPPHPVQVLRTLRSGDGTPRTFHCAPTCDRPHHSVHPAAQTGPVFHDVHDGPSPCPITVSLLPYLKTFDFDVSYQVPLHLFFVKMLFNTVSLLATVICAISAPVAQAAHSFAGSNLYYAAGLSSADRTTLFKYVFLLLLTFRCRPIPLAGVCKARR